MKNKKKTLFKTLFKNYMIFNFVTISLAILIFIVAIFRIQRLNRVPEEKTMSEIAELITSQGQYSDSQVRSLLGSDCILEIYQILNEGETTTDIQIANEKLDLIYFYGTNYFENVKYTDGELECIPLYDENSFTETFESTSLNGKMQLTIIRSMMVDEIIYDIDGNEQHNEYTKLLSNIICEKDDDGSYTIIYNSDSTSTRSSFTEKEISYLNQTTLKNYYVYKYLFESGNNNYLMIVKPSKHNTIADKYIFGNYYVDIISFVGCYLIIMFLYIYTINRQIIKPINYLNEAIKDYANTRTSKKINYTGSIEFEKIINSFENMKEQIEIADNVKKVQEEEHQKFICNLSHDLKTPITIIHGYIKALNDGLVKEENKEKYIKSLEEKSSDLIDLINNFYEFTQIKHPDFKYDFTVCDICEFTRNYIIRKYTDFELTNIELEINIPDEKIECLIDLSQFRRVFENIVSNSFKHSNSISKMCFDVTYNEDAVIIDICDNGLGVQDNIISTLFEPFVSGQSENKSGLGLYICKQIMENHGGNIMYLKNKREDYKSVFRIVVPRMWKE